MATLTTSYQLIEEITLGNNGYGDVIVRMYAKYNSQSIANNTSNISVQCRIQTYGGYWWSSSGTSYSIGIGSNSTGAISCNGQYNVGETTLGTYTKDIEHNANGVLDVAIAVNFTSQPWGWNQTPYKVVSLPTIPRYANITSFTISRYTEQIVKGSWSVDANVSYAYCRHREKGTSNWSDWRQVSWPNFEYGGLTASKKYEFQLKVLRADSGLPTESWVVEQETYDYPHCIESPNFKIGDDLTLKFYNPLGRNITIYVIGNNGAEIGGATTAGESITGYNYDEIVKWWYSTIPGSPTGNYSVKVVYGNSVRVSSLGGTYSIKQDECKPNFYDFDYSTNLSELTGNNNTIINGKTATTVIIPTTKKATGFQGAWITKYRFECGTQKQEINYSDAEISTVFYSCTSTVLKITAIDSRGVEKTVPKTVPIFKDYVPPIFSVTNTERKNGVDIETYLNLTIDFWDGNFGNGDNKITWASYRTKKRKEEIFSDWEPINLTSFSLSGNKAYLEKYIIHANGKNGGFEIGIAYDVQVQISDGLDTYVLTNVISNLFPITDGKVSFSMLKDENGDYHVGIDGMPDLKATLAIKSRVPLTSVQPTETKGNEELWVQASKNLFDFNGGYKCYHSQGKNPTLTDTAITLPSSDGNAGYTLFEQIIKIDGPITFSAVVHGGDGYARPLLIPMDENKNVLTGMSITGYTYNTHYKGYYRDLQPGEYQQTFNFGSAVKYLQLGFVHIPCAFDLIQIENGVKASSYETFAPKKIHTKNGNNEYDMFFDVDKAESEIEKISAIQDDISYLKSKRVICEYLGNNPDINSLKGQSGIYGLYNCSQAPNGAIAVLEVLVYTPDWLIQRFTTIGATPNMWERAYHSGTTWGEWIQRW